MDYILTIDERQLKIPNVNNEKQTGTMGDPIIMVDGSRRYESNHGDRVMIEKSTIANLSSELEYQMLYGYLKGRGGARETIYLERLGTTIEGYIRIKEANAKFEGGILRRQLEITIWEG